MMPDLDSISLFAVVPVFVNAGAALFPAILAAVASVLGLLFKPRDLLRVCVRKPWVPILVMVFVAGGYFVAPRLVGRATAPTSLLGEEPNKQVVGDWTAVALELIRQDERQWRETWLEERDRRIAVEQRVEQVKRQLDTTTGEPDAADTTDQDKAAIGEDVR
jgi:hypothetical protein